MESTPAKQTTVKELRVKCTAAGLPTKGSKDELISRLADHSEAPPETKPNGQGQGTIPGVKNPKPTGGGKQKPKHNASLSLVQVETQTADIVLKTFNGERTRVIIPLYAQLDPATSGLPKDIALAAKRLWQAAGTLEGSASNILAPKRAWSLQVYTFEHGTTGEFSLATEVKGDPKVSISGKDAWRLSWKVSVDLTKADMDRVHNLLRAESFRLTTKDAQTDVED